MTLILLFLFGVSGKGKNGTCMSLLSTLLLARRMEKRRLIILVGEERAGYSLSEKSVWYSELI